LGNQLTFDKIDLARERLVSFGYSGSILAISFWIFIAGLFDIDGFAVIWLTDYSRRVQY